MYIYSYFALYYTNTKNKAIKRASGASASPDVINAFHSSQIQPLIDWPPAGAVPPDCGQYGCKSFKQGRNLSQMFLQPQSVPVRGVEGGEGFLWRFIIYAYYHTVRSCGTSTKFKIPALRWNSSLKYFPRDISRERPSL